MIMTEEFDFDARYKVDEYEGIAWNVVDYATEWTEESWTYIGGDRDDENNYLYNRPEEIEDRNYMVCYMVGDDRKFVFGIDQLTKLEEDEYCSECGQIGCKANG
jgi:hypothetical protein